MAQKGMDIKKTPDEMFKTVSGADASKCSSLLKKYFDKKTFDLLKDKKTPLNGTLAQCINSGVENLDSGTGIYACDPDAYDTFKELFEPIIKDYHNMKELKHPEPTLGDPDNLPFSDVDPEGNFVISTRVRVGRSAKGIPFPPLINKEQRKSIEEKAQKAFAALPGEYSGKYFSLETMSKTDEQQLIDDHFLFRNNDRFLETAGGYRDWPEARGIFFNKDKNFLVWVNEEDHFRIISMQKGGNLGQVYSRLIKGVNTIEKHCEFAHAKKFGYLTFCPTNLGTTLRASVHIKVPKLEASGKLKPLCAELQLQPRGVDGEHTKSKGGVYDISNKRRLGISELQAVSEMAAGIKKIIEAEKACK